MIDFNLQIVGWYRLNKRSLPWRETNDPYHIWFSEIILQQTRVAQGLPYYQKFMEQFPTLIDLANADEQEVLRLWQGLGYYSRARNMHQTAKFIAENLKGVFPKSYAELIKLKGIGAYTASAIASFCYQENKAVVDGNVIRVLSRVFDLDVDCLSTVGKKQFQELADSLINASNPAEHNQAIMEFGALQCTPKNPNCMDCVLQEKCLSFLSNTVLQRPVKLKKTSIKHRYFHYYILIKDAGIYIRKRDQKDIWQNMYELPKLEFDKLQPESEQEFFVTKGQKPHVLSHQKLHIRFFTCDDLPEACAQDAIWVPFSDLINYPFPKPIEHYINSYLA